MTAATCPVTEPYDRERPHASLSVCNREECIRDGLRWVAGETNETSAYYPDSERRAAS